MSTLLHMNKSYDKICRVCMDNTDLQPIYEFNDKFDNETIDLSHKIKFCCNIECNVKDRMPKYICGVCSDALTVAYDLIMLCKYTDDFLRKNIGIVGDSCSAELEGVKIKTEYMPLDTNDVECSYDSCEDRKDEIRKSYKLEHDRSQMSNECERTKEKVVEIKTKTKKGSKKTNDVKKKRKRTGKKNTGSCVCEECGRCCKNQYELSRHRVMHEPKMYRQCPKCPYRTTDRHSYNVHIKFTHEGHPPLQCDMCSYQTPRKDYLKIHIMSHTGVKKYSCTLCDYKAINHSNLKRHMVKHTDVRNYKCDVCGAEYTSKQHLKIHTLRVHEHVPMFYCTLCPRRKQYVGEKKYRKHMMKDHPTEALASNLISTGSNDTLLYR